MLHCVGIVLRGGRQLQLSLTLMKPGTYTYDCLFHDDTEHVIGTVIVQ